MPATSKSQFGSAVPHRDQSLKSFDQFEPSHKEKIWGFLRAGRRVLPVLVDAVDKVGQVGNGLAESALCVHSGGEAAGRDKLIYMAGHAIQQSGVTP